VPVKGQDQFRLFESIDVSTVPGWEWTEGPGLFSGWFDEVTLPASMKADWFWTFTYPDGSSSSRMQPWRPFVTGTLTAIPEPGTLALLITALGPAAWACSRPCRRRLARRFPSRHLG
jgi:hypothetical protein